MYTFVVHPYYIDGWPQHHKMLLSVSWIPEISDMCQHIRIPASHLNAHLYSDICPITDIINIHSCNVVNVHAMSLEPKCLRFNYFLFSGTRV
jgi:hypothetical protein